jgi:hypothetical protein
MNRQCLCGRTIKHAHGRCSYCLSGRYANDSRLPVPPAYAAEHEGRLAAHEARVRAEMARLGLPLGRSNGRRRKHR